MARHRGEMVRMVGVYAVHWNILELFIKTLVEYTHNDIHTKHSKHILETQISYNTQTDGIQLEITTFC